jgi:hypothetical protein
LGGPTWPPKASALYEKGKSVSEKQMKQLEISYHKKLPKWNYTLSASKRESIFK